MYEALDLDLGTANLLRNLERARIPIEELAGGSRPDSEVTNLLELIKDLHAVTDSLDELATRERRNLSAPIRSLSSGDRLHLKAVSRSTSVIVQESVGDLDLLKACSLQLRTEVLRILYNAIDLLQKKDDVEEDGNLSFEARGVASTLHYRIQSVQSRIGDNVEVRNAVSAATQVTLLVPATTINQHLLLPRSIRGCYTGREKEMSILKASIADTSLPGQKRFVIYGLAGSGKTELAVKYAEDNLQLYWGVFFVDASSRKNAAASFAEIAKRGGFEANEGAGKNWLTTVTAPWLLLVDNADDDEVPLGDLFPVGPKGTILITSRNPAHRSEGTAGQRSLELRPMEEEEANELILRAAEEPSPWPKSITDMARSICRALGFLPLALVQAGKAILAELCSWSNFIPYYERQLASVRRGRHQRQHSRHRMLQTDDDDRLNVFVTYEILYGSLVASQDERFQDAVELLQVFSYLHFQNIPLELFVNAAIDPLREAREDQRMAQEEAELVKKLDGVKQPGWSLWFREQVLQLVARLDRPPILSALKNLDGLSEAHLEEEVRDRLGRALSVLISRSLIMKQSREGGLYCMHPLVHQWVRERPDTATWQQALWCEIATTTLARGILLPPHGDTEAKRAARRGLLPHINEVIKHRRRILEKLKENRPWRAQWIWPIRRDSGFDRHEAQRAARYSRVFFECGHFNEALDLQSKVRDFAIRSFGEAHRISIMATLLQVATLRDLTRWDDGTRLQRGAYKVCVESLGQNHPLTLKVTDLLALTLCWKGRLGEAKKLQAIAVEGMRRVYGADHENTLKAVNIQGRIYARLMEFERAAELHLSAWKGLREKLGETHVETLVCLEDLSIVRMWLAGDDLDECHDRMAFVVKHRERIFGREQPYTLGAKLNLCQAKLAIGQAQKATEILEEIIPIAENNPVLGPEHLAVVSAKMHYARALTLLGRFPEAEKVFALVVDKPQYRKATDEDGEHPDRLGAQWFLADCLTRQGKLQQAVDLCRETMQSLQEIGGNGLGMQHRFAGIVRNEIARLEREIREAEGSSYMMQLLESGT
ncbi:hypothetical protein M406DRAFT_328878 [Cryphonectria parasitica EP155]|uniref:NB-ARC domain-containing protein n=1 Tax=Cryphonectria parasitica (strain ATCC 38755 / EP155) TaxID=660469 RepID=A0A9P5CQS6_CRYP1|nr:uncharacterized protein M406DRAFT_328878 [Cryphonectria parasitica EP155]KAF3767824.1 hypothetical protein M406DRAFT_328878 [Cryphonectria parasitica EP155]